LPIAAPDSAITQGVSLLHGCGCSVHAIEPHEYNYRILETVIAGVANVRLYRMAISARPGMTDLFTHVRALQTGTGAGSFRKRAPTLLHPQTGRDATAR
jgi:hypothetical protein